MYCGYVPGIISLEMIRDGIRQLATNINIVVPLHIYIQDVPSEAGT